MTRNLYIDPVTKDLALQNYNLRLTENNSEFISQKIEQRLQHFQGEWWLNPNAGVPYYISIFVKRPDLEMVRSIFLNVVQNTIGVDQVIEFEVSLNSGIRNYTVNFTVKINSGELVTSEVEI